MAPINRKAGVIPFRWWIATLLFASTTINYIDRQTLSVLAPYLKRDFSWSNSDFALIVIAFRAAYTIFQVVSGRLLDRLGTRRGLSFAVLWYSVVAMATSLAGGLRSFAVFRFLLGAGEAANWPGVRGLGNYLRHQYHSRFGLSRQALHACRQAAGRWGRPT